MVVEFQLVLQAAFLGRKGLCDQPPVRDRGTSDNYQDCKAVVRGDLPTCKTPIRARKPLAVGCLAYGDGGECGY